MLCASWLTCPRLMATFLYRHNKEDTSRAYTYSVCLLSALHSLSSQQQRLTESAMAASGGSEAAAISSEVANQIEDIKDFTEPTFKQERTIKTDVESKWQEEGVGAQVRRSIGRYNLPTLGASPAPPAPAADARGCPLVSVHTH